MGEGRRGLSGPLFRDTPVDEVGSGLCLGRIGVDGQAGHSAQRRTLSLIHILRRHYGWVWYQRKVTLPAFCAGQRVVLRFGSVTHLSLIHI